METLSIVFSSSPPLRNNPKTHKPHSSKTTYLLPNSHSLISHQTHFPSSYTVHVPHQTPLPIKPTTNHISNPLQNHLSTLKTSHFADFFVKPSLSFTLMEFFTSLPCFASETIVSTEQVSDKINLEAILVSIDEFLNRNPFFVSGVTFIWLVVTPLTQEYLKKYKFISAIDAFWKLRDDPNAQLLDIRGKKNLAYLGSPNLKILNKSVVQIQFSEGDEGFVKKVLENFVDPANTLLCVLDNFDGNSMKVAELLFKNGFKEVYAIRGGVRGKDGWQAIQENLLPPSVHIYPKKVKMSQQPETNGGVNKQYANSYEDGSQSMDNGYVKKSMESTPKTKLDSRSSSPYPNYLDLKPPSSPTPARPQT